MSTETPMECPNCSENHDRAEHRRLEDAGAFDPGHLRGVIRDVLDGIVGTEHEDADVGLGAVHVEALRAALAGRYEPSAGVPPMDECEVCAGDCGQAVGTVSFDFPGVHMSVLFGQGCLDAVVRTMARQWNEAVARQNEATRAWSAMLGLDFSAGASTREGEGLDRINATQGAPAGSITPPVDLSPEDAADGIASVTMAVWQLINRHADQLTGTDFNVIRGWLDCTIRPALFGDREDVYEFSAGGAGSAFPDPPPTTGAPGAATPGAPSSLEDVHENVVIDRRDEAP